MKVLISSCLLGNNVRWNGLNKKSESISKWAESVGLTLQPVCPEDELFGTPRPPIRLIDIYGKVQARFKGRDIIGILDEKCLDIFNRHPDAVGFIGISRSPSCGISVGVKNHGKTVKGSMHRVSKIATTEINQLKNQRQRDIFLSRLNKQNNQFEKEKD